MGFFGVCDWRRRMLERGGSRRAEAIYLLWTLHDGSSDIGERGVISQADGGFVGLDSQIAPERGQIGCYGFVFPLGVEIFEYLRAGCGIAGCKYARDGPVGAEAAAGAGDGAHRILQAVFVLSLAVD